MQVEFGRATRELFGHQNTTIRYLRDNALLELLDDVSEQNTSLVVIGLLFMGSFCILSMMSKMVLLPVLSVVGLLVVTLSMKTTYWIMAVVGISSNVTTNSVLPFLAIGMGVDDMFIMLRMFQKVALEQIPLRNRANAIAPAGDQAAANPDSCLTMTMAEVGRAMTMTSASNFLAFLAASTVPVLAVSSFCQSCAIVVAVNYVFMIFLYAPIVGIFELFLAPVGFYDSADGGDASAAEGSVAATGSAALRFQQSAPGKGLAVVIKVALLALAIVGSGKIKYGISISDIAPTDSEEYLFTESFQRYYSFAQMTLRTGNIWADFAGRQQELLDAVDKLSESKYVQDKTRKTRQDVQDEMCATCASPNRQPEHGPPAANSDSKGTSCLASRV